MPCLSHAYSHYSNDVLGGCDLELGLWSGLVGEEIAFVTFAGNTVSRKVVEYCRHIVWPDISQLVASARKNEDLAKGKEMAEDRCQ